jgi:hypothetical protein
MNVFRRTAGHTIFDHKRNEDILEELTVEAVDEKLRRHKQKCLRHVARMNNKMIPKLIPNYRPNGDRRLGRPLKRPK